MKSSSYVSLAVQNLFLIFLQSVHSRQLCPPPDVPSNGDYQPKQNDFQSPDSVTYNCSESYMLIGEKTSRCTSKGEWSTAAPFCDIKTEIRSPIAINMQGKFESRPEIADGNINTCTTIGRGESINVTLDRAASIYAIRLFLKQGPTAFNIVSQFGLCTDFSTYVDSNKWILLPCKRSTAASSSVTVQDKSDNRSNMKTNSTICEIEVFVKEEGSCDRPPGPNRRVDNGYFEVTHTMAKLICESGYQAESGSDRLVCQNNAWVRSRLQCMEILCKPKMNTPVAPGNEWIFLDTASKLSAGTRKQLKCREGYTKAGGPDIVVCQKNGMWTNTNATCIEVPKAQPTTRQTIIGVVIGILALIVVVLFVYMIHLVRKER